MKYPVKIENGMLFVKYDKWRVLMPCKRITPKQYDRARELFLVKSGLIQRGITKDQITFHFMG